MDNIDNFLEKDLYDDVHKWFDEKIKQNPKDYEAWYYKGCVFSDDFSWYKAIECYNEAIKINPNNFQIWFKKGCELFYSSMDKADSEKAECFKDAIECFDEAIKLNPNSDKAWHWKGATFADEGVFCKKIECFNEALKCYDEAIKLNPNAYSAYSNRAYLRYELQDYAGAIEDYSKSIEIDPNDFRDYDTFIRACEMIGDDEGARMMKEKKAIAEKEN